MNWYPLLLAGTILLGFRTLSDFCKYFQIIECCDCEQYRAGKRLFYNIIFAAIGGFCVFYDAPGYPFLFTCTLLIGLRMLPDIGKSIEFIGCCPCEQKRATLRLLLNVSFFSMAILNSIDNPIGQMILFILFLVCLLYWCFMQIH